MRDEYGFLQSNEYQFFSYLDDIVMACDNSVAHIFFRAWEEKLQSIGLQIQPSKVHIHSPEGSCDEFLRKVGWSIRPQRGLIVCGLPGCPTMTLQARQDLAVGAEGLLLRGSISNSEKWPSVCQRLLLWPLCLRTMGAIFVYI